MSNFTEKITDEFLDQKRQIADPVADAVIEHLVREQGQDAAMKFFDQLIRNIRLPVELLHAEDRSLAVALRKLPQWADAQKLKQGELLFTDHGPKFLLFLYFKSLPLLYSMANGAEVLAATGRLAHNEETLNVFSRRIAETGQFLMDTMCPGGIGGGGSGIDTVVKVRLIHASIRKFVARESWDAEKLGKPINQEDLAATLMTFSVTMLESLEQFEISPPPEQQEGYLHTWKVIGHLLGIDRDLLPDTVADGKFLLRRILERQSARSQAGILLTKALITFARQNFKSGLIHNLPKALIRFLCGPKISEILNVQPRYLWLYDLLPTFLKRLFNWIERLEDHSTGINLLIDELSKAAVRGMVGYFNRSKDKRFEVPKSLQNEWQL